MIQLFVNRHGESFAILDHTVIPATQHKWMRPTLEWVQKLKKTGKSLLRSMQRRSSSKQHVNVHTWGIASPPLNLPAVPLTSSWWQRLTSQAIFRKAALLINSLDKWNWNWEVPPPSHVTLVVRGLNDSSPQQVISELRGVTCHMGLHSVTCHPTQVNTLHLNPRQTGWYSIYLPRRNGRLSWPRWLVTYQDVYPPADAHPSKY